ncbi:MULTISPECIES: inositol monophosphatase family protein [unclassified Ruegeria]|uniref:inositol monophosphatase family protein n=1 Tax=unclassified Ruegeria TaxID=2625375 RepID=UPI0014919DA6|nr:MULTISPECIES: inositol monophosphatase family protein [unclassified Ruegeria]NOD88310.1 inositol monophosphatase [Ruegeria sp. HKCCD4318]NOE13219.1 inositol monophosphatase [Ruegeria sp. HKCCD4318-2]NOG11239.1 inositol monophosphatase [Ruegeria sp. HKCCD4315]
MVVAHTLKEHAIQMADIASSSAMRFFRGSLGVEFKLDESPVTQADKAVEAEVRSYLNQHFPEHGVFGEEHGQEAGDGRHMWVIDPIDGTRSFLSGHPLFGFLLAHLVDGQPQLGLVGMPALNEVYVGVIGEGAALNGEPIRTSQQKRLDQSILYVNEGDKIHRDHLDLFNRLMQAGQTRRFAYDCYPHALLAAGHVDAVVDYDLQPYDYLAVAPLIAAAGGVMTDWQGRALTLESDGAVVSAATPDLHADLLKLINT